MKRKYILGPLKFTAQRKILVKEMDHVHSLMTSQRYARVKKVLLILSPWWRHLFLLFSSVSWWSKIGEKLKSIYTLYYCVHCTCFNIFYGFSLIKDFSTHSKQKQYPKTKIYLTNSKCMPNLVWTNSVIVLFLNPLHFNS